MGRAAPARRAQLARALCRIVAGRPGTPLAQARSGPEARYLERRYDATTRSSEGMNMAVAKVSEISATSSKSFEDALQQGLARANKTLRNVKAAWVKEQQVHVSKGAITEYQVNMMVTFVIDD
jgi:flavin-binding protein dodecin